MSSFINSSCSPMELSDQDVIQAMKTMQGYIDITPRDFKEVYRLAFNLAIKRLTSALQAKDIMSAPVHVIKSNANLGDAAKLLADKGISGAPVVDDTGKIVGVVSEKDFLAIMGAGQKKSFMEIISYCLLGKSCLAKPLRHQSTGDILTSPAITGNEEISIARIAEIFTEKHINRLPIVDSDGRPIGIVTRTDMVTGQCAFL